VSNSEGSFFNKHIENTPTSKLPNSQNERKGGSKSQAVQMTNIILNLFRNRKASAKTRIKFFISIAFFGYNESYEESDVQNLRMQGYTDALVMEVTHGMA
jgi:hypothetical protein